MHYHLKFFLFHYQLFENYNHQREVLIYSHYFSCLRKALYQLLHKLRQIGPLLLEVEDRIVLKDELESSMNTLSEHLQKLQQSETEIRELYEQAINSFESQ